MVWILFCTSRGRLCAICSIVPWTKDVALIVSVRNDPSMDRCHYWWPALTTGAVLTPFFLCSVPQTTCLICLSPTSWRTTSATTWCWSQGTSTPPPTPPLCPRPVLRPGWEWDPTSITPGWVSDWCKLRQSCSKWHRVTKQQGWHVHTHTFHTVKQQMYLFILQFNRCF